MATALTEADAFTATVVAGDDGDDVSAATFAVPMQALANRTRYLQNRRPLAYRAINTTDYAVSSSDPDLALNSIVVPMLTGETLLITSCGGFWGAALTSVELFAYLAANGVRLIEAWHSVPYISGGGVGQRVGFALVASYVATADGNVTIDHSIGVTVGNGNTRRPAALNILRVR